MGKLWHITAVYGDSHIHVSESVMHKRLKRKIREDALRKLSGIRRGPIPEEFEVYGRERLRLLEPWPPPWAHCATVRIAGGGDEGKKGGG